MKKLLALLVVAGILSISVGCTETKPSSSKPSGKTSVPTGKSDKMEKKDKMDEKKPEEKKPEEKKPEEKKPEEKKPEEKKPEEKKPEEKKKDK